MNPFKNILSVLVWIASLIMIFEVEIRSIGHLETEPVHAIGLLPHVWLSDVGLILPIFFAFLMGKFESMFLKNKIMIFLIVSFLYGIIIFFARNNSFYMFGQDLRVFLALFTGLSMGAIFPNRQKTIAAGLTLTSASAIFIATVILFALPRADFMHFFARTTHPSAFILLGLSIVFTGPSMIFSILVRNRKLIAISWLNAGMLLIISILIMQTRSQSIAVALGIIVAIMTTFILSSYFNQSSKKRKPLKMAWKVIVIFLIFIIATLYVGSDNLEPFLLRMQSAFTFQTDVGIALRLEEVPAVFGPMNLFDHIIGMGFNPVSPLIDWRGNPYNTMHPGILNIWWRLGFPIFLVVVYLFIQLLIKFFKSLKYLYSRSLWNKVNNETFATIICAPGVITLFVIACMSGGWSSSTMIPLGILWGIYRKMAMGYAQQKRLSPF